MRTKQDHECRGFSTVANDVGAKKHAKKKLPLLGGVCVCVCVCVYVRARARVRERERERGKGWLNWNIMTWRLRGFGLKVYTVGSSGSSTFRPRLEPHPWSSWVSRLLTQPVDPGSCQPLHLHEPIPYNQSLSILRNHHLPKGEAALIPGSGRSPGEGNGNPLQWVPGKFHGQRSLVGYSPWGSKDLYTTEWLATTAFIIHMRLKIK